jgi:hypothetical protein
MKLSCLPSHLKCEVLWISAAVALWLSPMAWAQTTVTANPAKGATGVALNTPMTFTFSKAMNTDPDQTSAVFIANSASPVDVTDAWNAGATVLTCTPTTGSWPATASIQWILTATDIDGNLVTEPPFGIPPMGTFTTGSGGSTGDTNPPALLSSSPVNLALGVPLNHPIKFTFDEAMQAAQSIQWSANLTPANFTYTWSTDARTLTCAYKANLPTNATITWRLNPSGSLLFKDAAGNALAADVNTGSFTTSDKVDPCYTGPGDTSRGSFSLSRQVSYAQTGTGLPAESGDPVAAFYASLSPPTNSSNPVTSAQLATPSGPHVLTNFFNIAYMYLDSYASQMDLDNSHIPGNYTLQVNRTTGGQQSAVLNLKASDWPNVPQILNLVTLQSADATSDVLVQWNGFTGAGKTESIQLHIDLGNGESFDAPDPCAGIELANTATSILVPKGILAKGKTYDATLTYVHVGPYDTNSIPDISAFASASKILDFTIVTGSGGVAPKSPTIGSLTVTGQGLQASITGAAPNQSIQVQKSSTLLPGSWTLVDTLQADASGNANYVFPHDPGPGAEFYQLVTP